MENLTEIIGTWGIIVIGIVLIIIAYSGSILPALPGVPFATAAVFLVHFTLHKYALWVLITAVVLTILISIADYYVPIWGTKKYGGSKAGIRGSTVGLIIGVFISFFTAGFGVIALFAGPFIGAFIGEKYFANANNEVALRSAWGSFVGFLAGTAGKIIVVTILTIIFITGIVQYL